MKLRHWRARAGLSLAEVGRGVGRSHVTVMRIERGDNPPDKETVQAIYEFTKGEVSLLDWFTEDGTPIPQSGTPTTDGSEAAA